MVLRVLRSLFIYGAVFFMLCAIATIPSETAFALEMIQNDTDSSDHLRVMTYNLRYATEEPLVAWPERRPLIRALLEHEQPDVFGTQEGLEQQIKNMTADLTEYNRVDTHRSGEKGEFTTVFYKKKRLKPLKSGAFMLSDQPEVVGSKTWGNDIPRMTSWVRFQDLLTEQQFYLLNTHFDHTSQEAREKSANLILRKIKTFDPSLPVILTGDFNASPDTVPYDMLVHNGSFTDLWKMIRSPEQGGLGTFNNFSDARGGGPQRRVDWLLGNEHVTVKSAKIVDDQYDGQYPSDHFPVVADVELHDLKD